MASVKLITERLVLRTPIPITPSSSSSEGSDATSRDAKGYTYLLTNPKTFEYEPHKPDLAGKTHEELCAKYEGTAKRWAQSVKEGKSAQLVIYLRDAEGVEGEGQMIGCGGVNEFRKVAEKEGGGWLADIGVSIHSGHWRKGYASEALRAMLDWLFQEGTYANDKDSPSPRDIISKNTSQEDSKSATITQVFAQTLASNLPYQSLMASIGLPGQLDEKGSGFGPEFVFNISKDEWRNAKNRK